MLNTYLRCKVLALVEILKAESVVSDELDILILGNITLGVISNRKGTNKYYSTKFCSKT